MDVSELRPRQVNDEEDDQVQVLSNSNVQDDTNQTSASDSHDINQDQVASTSSQPNDQASASNQVPMLQPTNIARYLPLDTIIGIFLEVYKQDRDWLHFVSISHLCHPLNQRR